MHICTLDPSVVVVLKMVNKRAQNGELILNRYFDTEIEPLKVSMIKIKRKNRFLVVLQDTSIGLEG